MDFTLKKYKELGNAVIASEYTTLTFRQYFSAKSIPDKFVLLRHDVDRTPENALKMAELEHDLGILSTYYFRMRDDVFKPEIIKKIVNLSHEIGYHYEVVDKAKGNFERAIRFFEDELRDFRKICAIGTICMHGNPLSPWDNRDLWKHYNFEDFGIIGEPYLSIDYREAIYLTDTGRSWRSSVSVKDVVKSNANRLVEKMKNTDDVISILKNGTTDQIFILTHPNRWSDSYGAWLKELLWQNVKNVGKAAIKSYNMNSLKCTSR